MYVIQGNTAADSVAVGFKMEQKIQETSRKEQTSPAPSTPLEATLHEVLQYAQDQGTQSQFETLFLN